jgi:hypothetical protein
MKWQKAQEQFNGREKLVRLLCLLCFIAGCAVRSQQQGQLAIRWTPDPANAGKTTVEVSGLSAATLEQLQKAGWDSAQWQRLLSVFAESANAATNQNLPPMAGSYRVQANVLRFEPQFPLEPGVSYRAVLQPGQLPGANNSTVAAITAVFQLPPRETMPGTVVSRVYPSADVLPENLLKFYVHFSAPMSRGRIYDHIHLRDEKGKDIDLPFLEIDEELWDSTLTRLTLFIDPGRIKRGVRPLEEIGAALEAGKSYSLVIGREWKDAAGNSLKESFQKVFKVGPPDRKPPDPAQWKIESPPSGTRETVTIAFNKPMDHALSQHVISVAGPSGQPVQGTTVLADQERQWKFVPNNSWQAGGYQLVIQTTIEDLAGNNIGKPFDVDLFEGVQRKLTSSAVKLSFVIR